MAISIDPILPVIAAQGAATDVVLQPGAVIDAQVMKLLANNAVRIAIANLSIEVMSEIPLQVGQNLRLAVSQTPDGIRLAVLPQPNTAAAPPLAPADAVTIASGTPANAVAKPAAAAPLPQQGLTAPQALAVSVAAQMAATKQAGLSQLFADVQMAAASGVLPPSLQQVAAQLLARRPSLDAALSGDDIAAALRHSGLFLEQGLASRPPMAGGALPDMKAVLLVFKQMLSLQGEQAGKAEAASSPPLTPDAVAAKLALALSRETATLADAARINLPPPPLRGALPTAQAVAVPSLAHGAPAAEVMRRLRDDADGAIARTTLLQIASLPERADSTAARNDPAVPRWHFEIPFATAMGTAVAQFEIARDGGGDAGADAAKRVWRARFSLDVEPAGPVHALVSLSGETTSVRMWAERPATAGQLRDGVTQLSQALSRAELKPGDIVVRDGVPPQRAAAPAGHFLDRAS